MSSGRAAAEDGVGAHRVDRGFDSPQVHQTGLIRTPISDAKRYRIDDNTVRSHEAPSWNRPHDVHVGLADSPTPNFSEPEILPTV